MVRKDICLWFSFFAATLLPCVISGGARGQESGSEGNVPEYTARGEDLAKAYVELCGGKMIHAEDEDDSVAVPVADAVGAKKEAQVSQVWQVRIVRNDGSEINLMNKDAYFSPGEKGIKIFVKGSLPGYVVMTERKSGKNVPIFPDEKVKPERLLIPANEEVQLSGSFNLEENRRIENIRFSFFTCHASGIDVNQRDASDERHVEAANKLVEIAVNKGRDMDKLISQPDGDDTGKSGTMYFGMTGNSGYKELNFRKKEGAASVKPTSKPKPARDPNSDRVNL